MQRSTLWISSGAMPSTWPRCLERSSLRGGVTANRVLSRSSSVDLCGLALKQQGWSAVGCDSCCQMGGFLGLRERFVTAAREV